MGDCTGLRVRGVLYEKAAEAISVALDRHLESPTRKFWRDVFALLPKMFSVTKGFVDFVLSDRAGMIPFGALAYVCWKQDDPDWVRSIKDNTWVFQCSSKNSCEEIDHFIQYVVPVLFTSLGHCERMFETEAYGALWDLENDKMVKKAEPIERSYVSMGALSENYSAALMNRWKSSWMIMKENFR